MADLAISSAATLTGAGLASGDLVPILDVSAVAGSKGSRMTIAELGIGLRTVGGFDTLATQAANAVAITAGTITGLTGLAIRSTGAAFDLTFASAEVLTAGRTLSFNVGDAARTLTIPATGTVALRDTVNTFTAAQTISGASLTLSGDQSAAAWTTNGIRLIGVAGTLTDTTSSGTVAAGFTNKLGGNTIAASNATTFTNYITAYFSDPVAGSNVTLTNKWALGADSLRIGTSNQFTISNAGVVNFAGTINGPTSGLSNQVYYSICHSNSGMGSNTSNPASTSVL